MPLSSSENTRPAWPIQAWVNQNEGRFLGIFAGSFVSPAWWLMKWSLAPFLPLEMLQRQGLSLEGFLMIYARMDALSVETLFYQVLPRMLLCLAVSMGFLYLCGLAGKAIARKLKASSQPA